MSELDLREFQGTLAETFRRYLFTLNFLPDSERELRDAFWKALEAKDIFYRDSLLSVIPAYLSGGPAAALLGKKDIPRLDARLSRLSPAAFDLQRPLYVHQRQSLELAQKGRNVIVATGTGSGKTECFLLPVLNDALANPGDGVRAIVIYPLNALANDQLGRLRSLLAGIPEITFGRYTGETPLDRSQLIEAERREISGENERVSRVEIRSSPPHILLTNFAMLEYLLLRPRDNEIFRQQRLKYVILDEAHTYSGAQGIEVGFLMRRLQQVFPKSDLQFILTSATLGQDKKEIAKFGQNLTGAPFSTDEVVLGESYEPFTDLESGGSLDEYLRAVPNDESLRLWLSAAEDVGSLRRLVEPAGLNVRKEVMQETAPGSLLARWLVHNAELATLHKAASAKPITLDQACLEVWGTISEGTRRLTQWLVGLGSRSILKHDAPPLLPARYHLFFRGLRGAGVCLSARCPDRASHPETRWSSLVLEDRISCRACEAHLIPLLTCVHCGAPVLRAYEDGSGRWQSTAPTLSHLVHLLSWRDDFLGDDEEDPEDGVGVSEGRPACFCLRCRAVSIGSDCPPDCCRDPDQIRLHVLDSKGDGLLRLCPTCGGGKGGFQSVLREVSTGEDAATAVLAEAMVRALPEEDIGKPAYGKRLLAFSDSRQRAAHFAPYLARTTAETQYMKPLLEAIREVTKQGPASFESISERFLKFAQQQPYVIVRRTNEDGEFTSAIKRPGQLYREDREILKRECLISLLQHCTAPARARNTLSGLALASVRVDFNEEQRASLPERIPQIFTKRDDVGLSILQSLLYVILRKKALGLPDGVLLGHIQSLGPKAVSMHHNQGDRLEGRLRIRWNPYTAKKKDQVVLRSPQAEIVARFLKKDKLRDELLISTVLDSVWEAFRDLEILRQDYPNEFVLPYDRLLVETGNSWFSCGKCGALITFYAHGDCLLPNCGGRLHELTESDRKTRWAHHHWYHRWTEASPLPLEVREHTAQLTNEAGRDYQRRFTAGTVNVLSSSTTFELGVDVGQLKSVFLRNMPPTPANYIQRAGRAGRRREGASYSLTYARSFPHDQINYHEPLNIVKGTIPVPRINLANERLAQRHMNSFLLGRYLKDANVAAAREQITAEEFFLIPSRDLSAAASYGNWLDNQPTALQSAASVILSFPCSLDVTTALSDSVELLAEVSRALADRISAYEAQAAELEKIVKEASGRERREALRNFESVTRLSDQLKKERLIDHLASAHYLPSYAFPQDVVRLLVRQPNLTDRMRLERDAEYGISEYAPGAEIVVDGLLLVSRGLDLQNKELEVRNYRVCSKCNRVQFAATAREISSLCDSCAGPASGPRSKPRSFVVPRGFTTSIDEPALEVRLNRLRPPPNSEVFLIDGALPESFKPHLELKGVSVGYRADGKLFRANSGKQFKQFKICRFCGRGFDKAPKSHAKPWGVQCPNKTLIAVDLVCTFQTDTLQIRFDGLRPPPPTIDQTDFWISFQTAFTQAAADILVIPARDIDGTYRSQQRSGLHGELVVYDRVPGGAGYVERIAEELPAILAETHRRVLNCRNPQCDPLGSCYACLRTYGNQFQWESLHRNLVTDWLNEALAETK